MALLTATSTSTLPAPQGTTDTTSAVPTEVEFTCGCWNQCTLQQIANPTVTGCDDSCGELSSANLVPPSVLTSGWRTPDMTSTPILVAANTPDRPSLHLRDVQRHGASLLRVGSHNCNSRNACRRQEQTSCTWQHRSNNPRS